MITRRRRIKSENRSHVQFMALCARRLTARFPLLTYLLAGSVIYCFFLVFSLTLSGPYRSLRGGNISTNIHRRAVHVDGDFSSLQEVPSPNPARRGFSNHSVVLPMSEACPYCEVEPYSTRKNETHFFYEECEPVMDTKPYPTCNTIHEHPFDRQSDETQEVRFLSDGGTFRSARTILNPSIDHEEMVYRTLYSDGDFVHETFDMHSLDATVMEKATSSPSVVNAYAFCGQAVITEYCDDFKTFVVWNERFTFMERLVVVRQIAQALDAMHYVGHSDRATETSSPGAKRQNRLPTFAHLDIKPTNLVLSRLQGNGIHVLLNDFNLGLALRKRKGTDEMCNFPMHHRFGGAPELRQDKGYGVPINMIEFDIFRFGHVIHAVATEHLHISANQGVSLGSEIFEEDGISTHHWNESNAMRNVDHLAQIALQYAAIACTRENPSDRPSLEKLTGVLDEVASRLHFLTAEETPTDPVTPSAIRDLFQVL